MRNGQLKAEMYLSIQDTSAQQRQHFAGTIQLTMQWVTLPVSTVASKLPGINVGGMHNVPGINVHEDGLLAEVLSVRA